MNDQLRSLGTPSNNIHFDKPAMMSDGRQDRSWKSEAIVDNEMKQQSNSMSNWEYRKYLTNNANVIMTQNTQSGLSANVNHQMGSDKLGPNIPHTFNGIQDNTPVTSNTFSSDLKQIYLSREQQQARMSTHNVYAGNH